jgi:hypothetical protein
MAAEIVSSIIHQSLNIFDELMTLLFFCHFHLQNNLFFDRQKEAS